LGLQLVEKVILLAKQGLQNERLALSLAETGDVDGAKPYIREALSLYELWGTLAQMHHLQATTNQLGISFRCDQLMLLT